MDFRSSQSGSNARRYPEPTRANARANDNNISATEAQGDSAEAPRTTMQMRNTDQKPRKPLMLIVAIIAIIVLIGGSWFAWMKMAGGDTGIKTGQYQAVFLTNGQVYFGKVSDVNNSYVKLTDIYYLQVQQSVQPDNKNTDKDDQSQVSLAKLGSELHGPEDTMHISRQQVLFWENLKNDGKVVQAINSYKQENK